MLVLTLFSSIAHADPQCPAGLEPSAWYSVQLQAGETETIGIPADFAGHHKLQILNDRSEPVGGSVAVFRDDGTGNWKGNLVEQKEVTYRTSTSDASAASEDVVYFVEFTAEKTAVFYARLCEDVSGNL
jgi:hypothetical protein